MHISLPIRGGMYSFVKNFTRKTITLEMESWISLIK
jgi:hypothetical protein